MRNKKKRILKGRSGRLGHSCRYICGGCLRNCSVGARGKFIFNIYIEVLGWSEESGIRNSQTPNI